MCSCSSLPDVSSRVRIVLMLPEQRANVPSRKTSGCRRCRCRLRIRHVSASAHTLQTVVRVKQMPCSTVWGVIKSTEIIYHESFSTAINIRMGSQPIRRCVHATHTHARTRARAAPQNRNEEVKFCYSRNGDCFMAPECSLTMSHCDRLRAARSRHSAAARLTPDFGKSGGGRSA